MNMMEFENIGGELIGRDYITAQEWSDNEIKKVLDIAGKFKKEFHEGDIRPILRYKTLFMLFFDPSLRTRNSFEAGMTQLGGHAHDLTLEKTWISHGEVAEDIGRVLSRYGHGIAIRNCYYGIGNQYIRKVAKASNVPVFNMQCDIYHPCQAIADLMTINEKFGNLKGKKLTISWAYTPRYDKPVSVPQSLVMLMPRFGLDVTLAYPPEFKLRDDIIEKARANAEKAGASIKITHDMGEAFDDANVVYPKGWGCMNTVVAREDIERISQKYKEWITTQELMDQTDKAYYMHCLPADRGAEVVDEVIDGPQSIVFDEAENRLHVQKAIMAMTMCSKKKL